MSHSPSRPIQSTISGKSFGTVSEITCHSLPTESTSAPSTVEWDRRTHSDNDRWKGQVLHYLRRTFVGSSEFGGSSNATGDAPVGAKDINCLKANGHHWQPPVRLINSERLERCLNHWSSQAAYLLLCGSHLVISKMWADEDDQHMLINLMWITLALVFPAVLLELLVRVDAESGPVCKPRSWWRFFGPWFYKSEAIILIVLVARLAWVCALMVIAEAGGEAPGELHASGGTAAGFLLFHRGLRAYGIFYNISVEGIEAKLSQRALAATLWMEDYKLQKQAYHARRSVQRQSCWNTLIAQFAILLLVLAYSIAQGSSRDGDAPQGLKKASVCLGWAVILVLSLELAVQVHAEGGELFFLPSLHKYEGLFFAVGIFLVLTINFRESETTFSTSMVVSSLLLIHRLLRHIGIRLGVSASIGGAKNMFTDSAISIFLAKFGDILEVPRANVRIKLQGSHLEVRVEKATLRPEGFEELHLPLLLQGGLVEDLHVSVPNAAKLWDVTAAEQAPQDARPGNGTADHTVVRMRNLLVNFRPGSGLYEAGRLDPVGTYWTHDNVVESQARLVEFLCKRLSPPSVQQLKQEEQESTRRRSTDSSDSECLGNSDDKDLKKQKAKRKSARSKLKKTQANAFARIKDRLASFAQERTLARIEVNVKTLVLQFEDKDPDRRHGHGDMISGIKVGSMQVRRKQGVFLTTNLTRVGVYVQAPSLKVKSFHDAHILVSGKDDTWAGRLTALNNLHPKSVVHELRRQAMAERLRVWSFEELGRLRPQTYRQRHTSAERWPERHFVFFLLKLKFHAGPNIGWSSAEAVDETELFEYVAMDLEEPCTHLLPVTLRTTPSPHAVPLHAAGATDGKPRMISVSSSTSRDNTRTVGSWQWHMRVHSVKVSFDNQQVSYLLKLLDCLQSWIALDHCFKWRPNLHLARDGAEAGTEERTALARLWWIYALHRVLAAFKSSKPSGFHWEFATWHASNLKRYSNLLLGHALRPPTLGVQWWEQRWMKELQVYLSLEEIVQCRKQALHAKAQAELLRRRGTNPELVVKIVSARLQQQLHPSLPQSQSKANAGNISAGGISSAVAPTISEPEKPEKQSEVQPGIFEGLAMFAGDWNIELLSLDISVLHARRGGMPRPVLLHFRVRGFFLDVTLRCRRDDEIIAATCTVNDFQVLCPDAGELALNAGRHVCLAKSLIQVPSAHPPLLSGGHVGNKVAYLIRLATLPNMRICEMMVPDYRIVVYEPLFQALLGFLKQPLSNAAAKRRITTTEAVSGKSVEVGHLERFGRHSSLTEESFTDARAIPRWHSHHNAVQHCSFHQRAAQVRQAKQLLREAQKEVRRFELLVGYRGDPHEWHADIIVGTVQCMLVSKYSKNMALVEELRLWPFESRASRGDLEDVGGVMEAMLTPRPMTPHTPRNADIADRESKEAKKGVRSTMSRRVQVQGGCLNNRSTSEAVSVNPKFFALDLPLEDKYLAPSPKKTPSSLSFSPLLVVARQCCSAELRRTADMPAPTRVPAPRLLPVTPPMTSRPCSPGRLKQNYRQLVAADMPMWEVLIHTVSLQDIKQGWLDKRSACWREEVRRQKRKAHDGVSRQRSPGKA